MQTPTKRPCCSSYYHPPQGEHGETGGGEEYSQLRHGHDPHAVPNPVDPNYSHLKEV